MRVGAAFRVLFEVSKLRRAVEGMKSVLNLVCPVDIAPGEDEESRQRSRDMAGGRSANRRKAPGRRITRHREVVLPRHGNSK